MNERKPTIQKRGEKPKPVPNPLYDAFTFQMSAMLGVARQIKADKNFAVPSLVDRFLDEFGRKVT